MHDWSLRNLPGPQRVPCCSHANLQAFHVVFALLMEMPYVRYGVAQSLGGRN